MNKFAAILLSVLSFCISPLPAQETPTPPFVKTPPPGSTWSVIIESPDIPKKEKEKEKDAAKPAEEVKKISVPNALLMKSGRNGVILGQIFYTNDRRDTFYVTNGSLLVQASNTNKVFTLSLQTSERNPFSLQVSAFPGTAWIARENYKGAVKKNGIDYLQYELIVKIADRDIKMEALIRKDNRYPGEVKIDEVTYKFEAVTPFSENIPLPESYRAVLAREQDERLALDLMRKQNRDQAHSK